MNRKDSLNRAGFRVETFPDPNNDVDKTASKQYKYVPLRQMRPFNQWQNLLRGIPEKRIDPSIQYAITCMVTVSLLEKYRFAGKWPYASIFCKGIYIGAELLIAGDAVRILPPQVASFTRPQECTDVLVISSIRLHLHDINEEHSKDTSSLICGKSLITLVGAAYTLDSSRGYSPDSPTSERYPRPEPVPTDTVKYVLPTVGAAAYGTWYPLHGPKQKYEITHDRVLGRLYESGVMGMWTGTLGNRKTSNVPPSLSHDLFSVIAGRQYGTSSDERIPEAENGTVRWFWADTRVQALSLQTINGIEVGAYDTVRDLRTLQAWRARLKIVDGTFTPEDKKDSMLARQKGRPTGSRLIGGIVVGPDEESGSDEIDPPSKGSFSEAVRSQKGVGGMVGAGAALEEEAEDDEEEKVAETEPEDDGTDDEEEEVVYSSKVSIMEQKPEGESGGFIIPEDANIDMGPPPPPLNKRSTSKLSAEIRGPIKARKSTGGSRISFNYAGRYDSSVTPAMTQEIRGANWKGKGRADTATEDWDPDEPFRSVEPDNAVPIYEDDDENDLDEQDEDEESAAGLLAEPGPKDDDDYDIDEDDEDGDGDEDAGEDVDDDEDQERLRTLASFQKHTFDRVGQKIRF